MNVIVAALRGKYHWDEKLRLLELHGAVPGVVATLRLRGESPQAQEELNYHLGLLRYRSNLPIYQDPAPVAAPSPVPPPPDSPPPPPKPRPKGSYPKEIEKLIQRRARAINAREKAGRELTQLADELPQERRAELIAEQQGHHKVVAWATDIIHRWEQTGEVEMQPEPSDERYLSADEKRWKYLLTALPKARRQGRKEFAEALAAEKELLREKLGKPKRKRK